MQGEQPTLLHIVFPYLGPWGADMTAAFTGLALDIAGEPGLAWKVWLEDRASGTAGGAYLFRTRGAAERYLAKHTARLAGFGIMDMKVAMSAVNAELSRIDRATGLEAVAA